MKAHSYDDDMNFFSFSRLENLSIWPSSGSYNIHISCVCLLLLDNFSNASAVEFTSHSRSLMDHSTSIACDDIPSLREISSLVWQIIKRHFISTSHSCLLVSRRTFSAEDGYGALLCHDNLFKCDKRRRQQHIRAALAFRNIARKKKVYFVMFTFISSSCV